MKNFYKLFLVSMFSLVFLGACSSGDDDLPDTPIKPVQDQVTLSTTNLTIEAQEGTVSLNFTTNKLWTASSDQSWCKLDKTSGGAGNITLTLSFEANPTEQERTANITVKAGTATAAATVKQAKKPAEGGEESGEGSSIDDMKNHKW